MQQWLKLIESRYAPDTIEFNVKLKEWRELYAGAIFAASLTKTTKEKHYIGLPPNEPADVIIRRYVPITFRGKPALEAQNMKVQVTRCNLDVGETPTGQIENKNKPEYKNTVLLVHLQGTSRSFNLSDVVVYLKEQNVVYPSEIIVIGRIAKESGIAYKKGTFMEFMIYPEQGHAPVNLADSEAFFVFPSMMGNGHLGIATKLEKLKTVNLLPPDLAPDIG